MQQPTQKNAFDAVYQEQPSHSSLETEITTTDTDDQDAIPTYKEFQEIINDYLSNLSPKKRDKALVDHTRYCLIQDVLRHPRNTSISTAQFRFWVKKMFRLQPGSYDLVFHDNKPVAMREQIYDILVNAHREVLHGGRDKTSAIVRNQFSWIPKELVARFVRQCPTCICRRNGSQSLSAASYASKNSSPQQQVDYSTINNFYDVMSGPFLSHNNSNNNNNSTAITTTTGMGTPHVLLYTPSSSTKEGGDLSTFPFAEKKNKKMTPPHYITASNSSPPKRPFFGNNGLFENCEQYNEANSQNNDYSFQINNNNEYQIQQPHPSMRSPTTFYRRKEFQNYSTFTTNESPSYYNTVVGNSDNKSPAFENMFSKKSLSTTASISAVNTNRTNILYHNQEHSL